MATRARKRQEPELHQMTIVPRAPALAADIGRVVIRPRGRRRVIPLALTVHKPLLQPPTFTAIRR